MVLPELFVLEFESFVFFVAFVFATAFALKFEFSEVFTITSVLVFDVVSIVFVVSLATLLFWTNASAPALTRITATTIMANCVEMPCCECFMWLV